MFKQYHNKLIFPDFYQRFLTNIMHKRYEEVDCHSKHTGEAPHFSFIGSLWHNIWYCETQNFLSKCIFRSFFLYTLAFDKAKKLQTLPFKKHLHWVPLHTSSNIVSIFESTADSALSRETTPHRQGVTIQHVIGKSINALSLEGFVQGDTFQNIYCCYTF